jgi:hypothetical protein
MSLQRIFIVLIAFVATTAAGCGTLDLASAASKIANDQLGELTGHDIKVLSDAAVDALNSQDPTLHLTPLTQEQADALAAFLHANNVQTRADLTNLINNAETTTPAGLDDLAAAFDNVDPNNVDHEQLDLILQQVFGGGN